MKSLIILAMLLLLLIEGPCLKAAETVTNWNWLSFGLFIPQTNLALGDKILASMVCSNMAGDGHYLYPSHGDPCGPGFGEFLITEISSGKKIECKYPSRDRMPHSYSLGILDGHKTRNFEFDLAESYALTNAGAYIIQASGRFATNNLDQKPDFHFDVVTPPLEILLSSKGETNALLK